MKRVIAVIGIVAGIVIGGRYLLHPAVDKAVVASCNSGNYSGTIERWTQLGIIKSTSRATANGIIVEVNTGMWNSAYPEVRHAIALAAYCTVADVQSQGNVIVRGTNGEYLGAVANGNTTI